MKKLFVDNVLELEGWGWSSVVKSLPSMHIALDSIQSLKKEGIYTVTECKE
jgi:hypothetical protein